MWTFADMFADLIVTAVWMVPIWLGWKVYQRVVR